MRSRTDSIRFINTAVFHRYFLGTSATFFKINDSEVLSLTNLVSFCILTQNLLAFHIIEIEFVLAFHIPVQYLIDRAKL